jgi:hypothetical protein
MLRELAAFLTVFAMFSLIMRLDVMAYVFGLGALMLFAAHLIVALWGRSPRRTRQRTREWTTI